MCCIPPRTDPSLQMWAIVNELRRQVGVKEGDVVDKTEIR